MADVNTIRSAAGSRAAAIDEGLAHPYEQGVWHHVYRHVDHLCSGLGHLWPRCYDGSLGRSGADRP